MLSLRPCCEHCGIGLAPDSPQAMICSFECTFCRECVESVLQNVCPNCGGGFAPRPVRPSRDHKGGNFLGRYPAETRPTHRPVNLQEFGELLRRLRDVPPHLR